MPSTPVYGFPYEHPDTDQPGISINGGPLGTESILAETVETEMERIDNTVTDHESRLAALEAGTSMVGWTPVQAGASSGASFDIDLTDSGRFSVAEFALVRLLMRFDLDADGNVIATINADSSLVYTFGYRALDAVNPSGNLTAFPISPAALGVDEINFGNAAAGWRIGRGGTVSTNNLVATFFHMNGNNLHGFQSTSTRMSTSGTTHSQTEHWGALDSALSAAPSSIRISAFDGATSFTNAWWWAEGYRVP